MASFVRVSMPVDASGPIKHYLEAMPVILRKLKSGKVRVSTPGGVKSYGSTPKNAKRQRNLLNAVEHNPGFRDKLRKRVMKDY